MRQARTGTPASQIEGLEDDAAGARIVNGALSRIELDVEYADGVPGTWTAIDDVEPLGGAGTTQGCQP